MADVEAAAASHRDPRVPPRTRCVLRYVMDHWAEAQGDRVYAIFADGTRWTYRELRRRTIAVAAGLQKLGVRQGDHVAVWLPNGPEHLLAFYAINYLGAVFVPFNTAYKGRLLAHVLDNADAKLLICHGQLAARLADVDTGPVETVVMLGNGSAPDELQSVSFESLAGVDAELAPLARPIEPWDPQSIVYTSGTTGPSKGVLSSYLHMFSNAGPESWPFVTGEDRFLINMPLFHIGGMGVSYVMLVRGGSIAMMNGFDTESFWDFVRETNCTVAFLLGVMATFLLKRPPDPRERDHGLRRVFMVPLCESAAAFKDRFGPDVYTIFNMTEISSPIVSEANPPRLGTCGRVRPGVDVRLVDDNDCEVPVGTVGEMIVRTDRPWAMMSGYYKNADATASAWRNGWFHTGDGFRRDADGYYYFVDRIKDAIRRRGENISSFEVEAELVAHPAVREAAAIGVPSEYGEDEVMAVVAPVAGATIDPAALVDFLKDRMPYFMVPRYVRVMDDLPKTPSSKVQKAALRAAGVTPDSWDREAAKIKVKRERFQ
ncbi:MAG: ATP-dependent acyl-CoA ligase [Alphaproteobacteria bacterium]|nr:MAG: ATP-dependent acyl-CoA ligase [Alphaproteobacteria bacterium]